MATTTFDTTTIDPGQLAYELAAADCKENLELAAALRELAAAVGAGETGYWTPAERAASLCRRRASLLLAAHRLEQLGDAPVADCPIPQDAELADWFAPELLDNPNARRPAANPFHLD